MFEIGTYIVCGQHGVCRVEDIGKLKLSEASGNKDYYTLSQVYSRGGVLYVPADSDKIIMRPVITKEEAEDLIAHMTEIDPIQIDNEKRKDDIFKQAFKTCDNREWVKILKTLYARKAAAGCRRERRLQQVMSVFCALPGGQSLRRTGNLSRY